MLFQKDKPETPVSGNSPVQDRSLPHAERNTAPVEHSSADSSLLQSSPASREQQGLSPRGAITEEHTSAAGRELTEEHIIPVIAEQLEVGKRTVETGTVRLLKHTEERIETVDAPLTRVRYEVEHVPVDRVVAEPPPIRYEGDTTIYPVLEENLIVTRELRLREEIRVTRVSSITNERTSYRLIREDVRTERDGVEIGRTAHTPDHTSPAPTLEPRSS